MCATNTVALGKVRKLKPLASFTSRQRIVRLGTRANPIHHSIHCRDSRRIPHGAFHPPLCVAPPRRSLFFILLHPTSNSPFSSRVGGFHSSVTFCFSLSLMFFCVCLSVCGVPCSRSLPHQSLVGSCRACPLPCSAHLPLVCCGTFAARILSAALRDYSRSEP